MGRNLSGRSLDAVGILSGGCRGRSVLMLTDVRTWAQSFGAVGCFVLGASCRVCAVVALLDAYRRSDVGHDHSGRSCPGCGRVSWRVVAVALLCSALMLTDVQTLAQPFGGGGF